MVDMVRLIGSISDEKDQVKIPAFCACLPSCVPALFSLVV